jgi:hypothetical protein
VLCIQRFSPYGSLPPRRPTSATIKDKTGNEKHAKVLSVINTMMKFHSLPVVGVCHYVYMRSVSVLANMGFLKVFFSFTFMLFPQLLSSYTKVQQTLYLSGTLSGVGDDVAVPVGFMQMKSL